MDTTIEEFETMYVENIKNALELADNLAKLYHTKRDYRKQNFWKNRKYDMVEELEIIERGEADGS